MGLEENYDTFVSYVWVPYPATMIIFCGGHRHRRGRRSRSTLFVANCVGGGTMKSHHTSRRTEQ